MYVWMDGWMDKKAFLLFFIKSHFVLVFFYFCFRYFFFLCCWLLVCVFVEFF